ncbi:TetR/AcrR family transcriptional regulator [Melioribacteraceae bacterium 4301-Me]|uniref:TetR/AcrR family transcriptional regulator n=1 Tax=Pyranulibacter aquaticus TaxID=3163344 RepID=UPI003595D15E
MSKLKNTKEKILEVALDLFSVSGYSGTSIRDISKQVGLRESAIYNHFKSKEEIFLSIIDKYKSSSLSKKIFSDELLKELEIPQKFLVAFSNKLIDLWNEPEERKFMRLLLMEQFSKISGLEISVNGLLFELRSLCKIILGEMVKQGIIKKIDPEILADEFIAPLFLIRSELMVSNESSISEVKKLVEQHVDFFWNAVKL